MKLKKICEISIDFIMTVLLLVLMAFMITGQKSHEWLGTVMFVLFIIHNILNFRWYKNLLNQKYTLVRTVQTVINLLVFMSMIGLMISGIMMSRYVFRFLYISKGMSFARELHMVVSYSGFILMSLHLGLHWGMMMGMMRKVLRIMEPSHIRTIILRLIAALIAIYGLHSFIKHDIASYIFLKNKFAFFDYEQSGFDFYMDYLAMMGLCVFIAYYTLNRRK